jgi:hypothetical protein
MIRHAGKFLSRFWSPEGGPYALLVLLFLMVFVLAPLLSARILMPFVFQTAFWLIIVAGAFNVSSRRSIRLTALIVAVFSIALRVLSLSVFATAIEEVEIFLSLVMLSIFALLMIQNFLVTGRAWGHRITAAIAVYLLLGLIWSRL